MSDRATPARSVDVGALTVRGPGLTADHGRAFAHVLATTLARHLPAAASHIDALTVRVPAATLGDDAALSAAIAAELVRPNRERRGA